MDHEEHPFNWFIPPGAKTLFVGTFPPTANRWSYNFFYPNKANRFWKIIAAVNGRELAHFSGDEAVEERRQLLIDSKTGITDMGKKLRRTAGNSLDENLEIIEYMDILHILDTHPQINKLIFTSSSGPNSAAGWFIKYLGQKNIKHRFPAGPKPVLSSFEYNGRIINLMVLLSPSPRASNRMPFDELVQMYAKALQED